MMKIFSLHRAYTLRFVISTKFRSHMISHFRLYMTNHRRPKQISTTKLGTKKRSKDSKKMNQNPVLKSLGNIKDGVVIVNRKKVKLNGYRISYTIQKILQSSRWYDKKMILKDIRFLQLVRLLSDKRIKFTAINLSVIAPALVKLGFREKKTFDAISLQLQKCKKFGSRSIATILWSFATARIKPDTWLVRAFTKETLQNCNNFDARAIANILWALAKANIKPEHELVGALTNEILQKREHFSSQGIANILWAFATLNIVPEPKLIEAFKEQILQDCNNFNAQEIANTLWALAKANIELDPKLIKVLTNEILKKCEDFNPQGIANIIWAFATANITPEPELIKILTKKNLTKM